jgi:CheY-like chemotaxis protein
LADPTVLVVDDEPTILRMIGRILADLPCQIVTAYDAESAVELIDAGSPDLVITDIKLPGMDGLELAKSIKARNPALPVLLVSAYGEPRAHEGDAFIAKPFDNDHLVAVVKRCLET